MARTLIGNIKGPTGATGAKGDKGDAGATGPQGARGEHGTVWYSGTNITGTSTTATVFSSSGITAAALDDYYLNTSTGNVYRCTVAGAASVAKWVYVGCIKGLTGAKGDKGDKGDTGPQGPQGPAGTVANISSQAITFDTAASKSEILSGDTLAVLFGKLKKNQAEMDSDMDDVRADVSEAQEDIAALETNFTNLINDDTITAAENAGILSGGGLTLLNSILQLYLENAVVEEYDDEGWHIKKYANGYAECFGRVNVGQVTLGTQLGTDVVSNVIRIAFPITFEELPEYCSVTYEGNGTGYATLQSPGVSQLSTTHAYSVRLCRIGAQSTVLANNIFNVHVLGKYQ